MRFAKGTGQAVLYEIVGGDEIARQRAGIASQAGNFGFDVPIWVDQRELLPMATIGSRGDPKTKTLSR